MTEPTQVPRTDGRLSRVTLVVAILAGMVTGVALMTLIGSRQVPEAPIANAYTLPPGVIELSETAQVNAGLQTAEAGASMQPVTRQLTGVVAPDESRVAHVRPLARGVIETVSVNLGDRVQRGQALVTYDNIELGELVG